LLVAVGAFMGLGVLLNLGGPHGAAALLLAFVVFGLAPAAAGVWLLRGPVTEAAALLAAQRAWDSELLRLAARRDGSLSVAEVVAHADLDPKEAEQRLDELSRRGLCELRVTEEGVVVYRFLAAPSTTHKQLAQGVLDE
jgi:hypothetical protein